MHALPPSDRSRDLAPRVTTCPHFIRNAPRCGDGMRKPAEFLDFSLYSQDQESRLSSCRNRINSNPRSRQAPHVLVIEFRCFPGEPHHTSPTRRHQELRTYATRYASRAWTLAQTQTVIGKLLGHSDIETTARIAHLAHDSIHETAERIAVSISADIL